MNQREKSPLEKQILDLNSIDIFSYRDNNPRAAKKISNNILGQYADSIGHALWETNQKLVVILDEFAHENRKLTEENGKLRQQIDQLIEKNQTYENRFNELLGRLDECNERFDNHDKRLDECNERFDNHDKRLDECNMRFDNHDKRLDECNTRFDNHDKRLDECNMRFDNHDIRLDECNTRFDNHDKRLDECNMRFDNHDIRLDNYESKLDQLSDSELSVGSFAQSGEDMICNYVLKFLRTDMNKVTYLDLGANHAKELSNTYKFYKLGGRGVLVEANPELIPELEHQRHGDIILNRVIAPLTTKTKSSEFFVLSGDGLSTVDRESAEEACRINPNLSIKAVYEVDNISVKEITDKYFSSGLDILNIDLEGLEYDILKEFDFSTVRPKIIILENIEYKPYLVTEKNNNKKLTELLAENNYIEYAFTGINSLYIDRLFTEAINAEIVKELNEKK